MIAFQPIRESVGRPNIPDRFSQSYRIVSTNKVGYTITKLYTSNDSLMDYILDDIFLSINIDSVTAPINESHLAAIKDKDVDTVFREKYWYGTYQYKINITPRRDITISDEDATDLDDQIRDLFKNSRINQSYQPYYAHSWVSSRNWGQIAPYHQVNRVWWPPNIFTNSEEEVFLLKMRFSHLYQFKIIKIILLEEIVKG